MKITGFTIVRNALKYGYPAVEAITSVLPICDEFVVAVGRSDDDTLGLIKGIASPKIRIIETVWDDTLRDGSVLAEETNKAIAALPPDTDWGFYIQCDEVVHEADLPTIRAAAEAYLHQPEVEGLLFDYLHFYGSYAYVADSRKWYRKEIRMIRVNGRVKSWKDAQGFRNLADKKLKVKKINAKIYHYGWVRPPAVMRIKIADFNKFWHDETTVLNKNETIEKFDYSEIDSLQSFIGTHPAVMLPRVTALAWELSFDTTKKNFSPKNWLLYQIESITGWQPFEYKNYREV